MEFPVAMNRRAPRHVSRACRRPLSVGRARKYLKAAPGRALMMAALLIPLSSISYAQPASPSASQMDNEPLSEQVIDPLARLTQLQLKDLYTPAEYGTNAQPNTMQLRAIFAIHPFLFIPLEQLIRPTFRVVTVPDGKGASTSTAYDDMQLLDLFAMPWPNSRETDFRWGIGTYLVLPSASSDRTGRRSWQVGPAGAFSYTGISGLDIAGLLQQATSFAYTSSNSTPVCVLTFQPILSYQLGHEWYLKSSDATWIFNLRHNTSTIIPLSAGFGRVWEFSRNYALDTSISGEWMVYRQFANGTGQFTLNFQVGLVFPKLRL
jgi:hypothetical protein